MQEALNIAVNKAGLLVKKYEVIDIPAPFLTSISLYQKFQVSR